MDIEVLKDLKPLEYHAHFLRSKRRSDGRALLQARPFACEAATEPGDFSAVATSNGCTVEATVSVLLTRPLPEAPDSGAMDVRVQVSPVCRPPQLDVAPDVAAVVGEGSSGVTGARTPSMAVQLGARLTRMAVDARAVEVSRLGIVSGKACFCVLCDVLLLAVDGDPTAAACAALLAALERTQLPSCVATTNGDVRLASAEQLGALPEGAGLSAVPAQPLQERPVSIGVTTCALLADTRIVDPTWHEMRLASWVVTAAASSQPSEEAALLLLDKRGPAPAPQAELAAISQMASQLCSGSSSSSSSSSSSKAAGE